MTQANSGAPPENAIAIVGMAGRFPGAADLDQFWDNLDQGVMSISFFDRETLIAAGVPAALAASPDYVPAHGALDDIDRFDAAYFDIAPREAETMDPQQRFFLECCVTALEDAGVDPKRFDGLIGVFGGASFSSYLALLHNNGALRATVGDYQIMLGNDKDHLATRVSYKLSLKGPSMAVQTTCSTSLTAVYLACQSLLDFQCDMALAGGVSIAASQQIGYRYQQGGIRSPDGFCRAFDADARGCVAGSGVGVVALKRLEDALEDGDCIRAVIRGAAANNDGAGKAGYTAPSVDGQAEVVAAALAAADVPAETIDYVEAHGTGTRLGDPIEVAALQKAFGPQVGQGHCALGSVKTNIGHLDAAAGVAGLIKTTLALQHGRIPASLHYCRPNAEIDFEASPFYVAAESRPWPRRNRPRRAGVSSFGVGGTNIHVVLEEPPARAAGDPGRPATLLPFSARTPAALKAMTARFADFLEERPELSVADAAYTLQVGRRLHERRQTVIARDRDEALIALRRGGPATEAAATPPRLIFIFPDGEAACPAAVDALRRVEPALRERVDLLRDLLPPSGDPADQPGAATMIDGLALAQTLRDWGVAPDAVVGWGRGEWAAACFAGVFTPEDGLRLAAAKDADALDRALATVALQAPELPLMTISAGAWLSEAETSSTGFWRERTSGSFDQALAVLASEGAGLTVELGASSELGALIRRAGSHCAALFANTNAEDAPRAFFDCLGQLWARGAAVDWQTLYRQERRLRIALPTYPFEDQRHWGASGMQPVSGKTQSAPHAPLKKPPPPTAQPNRASTTELARDFAHVFAEQLGLPQVGPEDSFFDLGGDSLAALQIANHLERRFGASFDPALLDQHDTPAKLAAYAASRPEAERDPREPAIVALQPEGELAPVFLVHPIGGDLLGYRELAAQMDKKRPVYGLRAAELAEAEDEATTLETLAARYVRAIRRVWPQGPWHIAGWSFGGFIAFEMARQLRAQGAPAGMTAILDTPAPDPAVGRLSEMDELEILFLLAREWSGQHDARAWRPPPEIARDTLEAKLAYALNALQAQNLIPRNVDTAWLNRFIAGYRARIGLLAGYRAERYPGDVLLFRAESIDPAQFEASPSKLKEMMRAPHFGWDAFISGRIEVHALPGYHEALPLGPNAVAMARRLELYITKEMT